MLHSLTWWQWTTVVVLVALVVAAVFDRYLRRLPLPDSVRWILGAVAGLLGAVLLFRKPFSPEPDREERPTPKIPPSTSSIPEHHDDLDSTEAQHETINKVGPGTHYADPADALADFEQGATDDGILADD